MRRLLLLAVLIAMPHIASAQPAETIEYYGQDVIGSVRIVFSPNGTVLGRQDYEPFGRPLFTSPALPKEGFGGQETDDESDQAHFHARMFRRAQDGSHELTPFTTGSSILSGGIVTHIR